MKIVYSKLKSFFIVFNRFQQAVEMKSFSFRNQPFTTTKLTSQLNLMNFRYFVLFYWIISLSLISLLVLDLYGMIRNLI